MRHFCYCLLLFFLLPSFLKASFPLDVQLRAKAAILINAETGVVLFEKNAHEPLHPASTTKVATALYAISRQGDQLDVPIVATGDAVMAVPPNVRRSLDGRHPPYRLEFGGTHMNIKPEEVLSFRALVYGLMLVSANDAANVLAEHISGTIPQFLKELNEYVQSKGCLNTQFLAPHGLTHPNHKTTAYDMAVLTREALRLPFFREVVKTTQYQRPQTNKQPEKTLRQFNALLKPGQFFYPKAIGVKTGFTDNAGYTLVAAAEDQNRKLIAVLLGYETIEQRYKDAISLFEAAFNEKKVSRTVFSQQFDFFHTLIEGGKEPLQAHLLEDVQFTFFPSEEEEIQSNICWNQLELPILAGSEIGKVYVCSKGGRILATAPLFAHNSVTFKFSYQVHRSINRAKKVLNAHPSLVAGTLGVLLLVFLFVQNRKKI